MKEKINHGTSSEKKRNSFLSNLNPDEREYERNKQSIIEGLLNDPRHLEKMYQSLQKDLNRMSPQMLSYMQNGGDMGRLHSCTISPRQVTVANDIITDLGEEQEI